MFVSQKQIHINEVFGKDENSLHVSEQRNFEDSEMRDSSQSNFKTNNNKDKLPKLSLKANPSKRDQLMDLETPPENSKK